MIFWTGLMVKIIDQRSRSPRQWMQFPRIPNSSDHTRCKTMACSVVGGIIIMGQCGMTSWCHRIMSAEWKKLKCNTWEVLKRNFTVFFLLTKELITSDGCVEMDIPWQLCRTIGRLLSQRFLLASAKAQPKWDFYVHCTWCTTKTMQWRFLGRISRFISLG